MRTVASVGVVLMYPWREIYSISATSLPSFKAKQTKRPEVGAEKFYCRAMQDDSWSILQKRQTLKGFQQNTLFFSFPAKHF